MSEVDLFGEKFAVSGEEIPKFLIAELALAIADQPDTGSMPVDTALMRILKVCIRSQDWSRFRKAASAASADGEALIEVIGAVTKARRAVEDVTGRPTERPSDSSGGSPSTVARSTDGSSSPVIARLEGKGRPDLALMVTQAQEARVAG